MNVEGFYTLGDHLGSTSITVDESGAVVAELRYKAWGETRFASGDTPTTWRYTGQRQEEGLGLYYYRARWYDPAMGRFISADTVIPEIGKPLALDRYSYTYNNPIKYYDPTGHQVLPGWLEDFLDWLNPNGSNPPDKALSTDQLEVVEKISEFAIEQSESVSNGEITDCEALANVIDFAAEQHKKKSFLIFGGGYDDGAIKRDLGLVLGGIRIVATGFQSGSEYGAEDAQRSYLWEYTHYSNNPLSYLYVSNFGSSGFQDQFVDTDVGGGNQVRHFIGGLVPGSAWFPSLSQDYLLSRENASPADYQLHEKAFELLNLLNQNNRTHGNPNWLSFQFAGQWVMNNVCQINLE